MTRAAILILGLLAGPASAHSWYDAICCSDRDCQRIEPRNVRATPEGWLVTVEPSDHPFIKARTTRLYRYIDSLPGAQTIDGVPEARPSGDTEFHLCVGPNTGALLCLYVPEFGA